MKIQRPTNIKDPQLSRVLDQIFDLLTEHSNLIDKIKVVETPNKGVAIEVKDKKGDYKTDNLSEA